MDQNIKQEKEKKAKKVPGLITINYFSLILINCENAWWLPFDDDVAAAR